VTPTRAASNRSTHPLAPLRDLLLRTSRAFAQTLRNRNLRRAGLSFGAATAGDWAATVAVGILAFRSGGAAAVGLVAMVRMLPGALLGPVAGSVIDRYRRERVLLVAGTVQSFALACAALIVELGSSPVPAYAFVACATLALTVYRPAHAALLPSLCTTATELTSANAFRVGVDALSTLLGPLIAGALIGPVGAGGVFAVAAAAAAGGALLIAGVEYEVPPLIAAVAASRAWRAAVQGVVIIARTPALRLLGALGFAQTFTRGCFSVFSVVVALQLLGLPDSGVGILTAGLGIGAVVGSFAAPLLVRSSGFGRWLAAGVAGWGLPFVALAGVSNEVVAVALLVIVGIANVIVDLSYFTLLPWLVPDEVMGRVFASDEAIITIGVAVGAVVAPGLIDLFGIRDALIVAGLVAPLTALIALPRLRRLDAHMRVAGDTVLLLQRVKMLAPLPLATISQLAGRATQEVIEPGTVVMREGSPGDDFYVIADGQAEVLVDGQLVSELGPADCFGEIAALIGTLRTATIRARTSLTVLRFSGQHFLQAVTGYTPSGDAASSLVRVRLEHAVSSSAGIPEPPSADPATQAASVSDLDDHPPGA
jgi:MFS family permease